MNAAADSDQLFIREQCRRRRGSSSFREDYDYSDIKDKVILLRVAMAIGRKDLERMFRGILLPQEREEFDAAMETAQSGAPLS